MRLAHWDFSKVCDIDPRRDAAGDVVALHPQTRFANVNALPLNKYGNGPFCEFRVPAVADGRGVYAFIVDGELRNVGECDDFVGRLNTGYGTISPRNCFEGGQPTNCRVNNAVFDAANSRKRIELYFYPTAERFKVEEALLVTLRPSWNRKMVGNSRRALNAPRRRNTEVAGSWPEVGNACRDQVLVAARAIVARRGVNSFSAAEVVEYLRAAQTQYADSTIRTHVTSVCCVDAPRNHAVRFDDFSRVGPGEYRIIRS